MSVLCFVLMPFGPKKDAYLREVNFDTVYDSLIKPAIIAAGLEPIRADEETDGGFIHKPMYERLMFCDFAVADLSFSNANVFYELGIRHALKPFTTVSIFEDGTKQPFDTSPLRAMPYTFKDGIIKDVDAKVKSLAELLKVNLDMQMAKKDSPIGQLIQDYKFPDLGYLQQDADSFAKAAIAVKNQKENIADLVKQWKNANKIKAQTDDEKQKAEDDKKKALEGIKAIQAAEAANLRYKYDLLYALIAAYKSINAFKELTELLRPLVDGVFNDNIYIKQQLGFAYNKIKMGDEAEKVLLSIIDKYGPDPETNGLVGSVYKVMMNDNENDSDLFDAYRTKAIDAYLQGFETDQRNSYPGINALTLLYYKEEPDERFAKFLPIVAYAIERELITKANDYWAQATALELAALALNEKNAKRYYSNAIICKPDDWMKETTAANLQKIYNKALQTNDEQNLQWLKDITIKLNSAAFN